jgi:hypothetical protein
VSEDVISRPASRPRGEDAPLWLGIVVPPLAWAADELAGLVFSDFVCDSGHRWLLQAITVAALLLSAAAGAISWRAGASLVAEGGGARIEDRRRFMRSIAGWTTVFFLLVILAGAVPGLLHRPCD